MSDDLLNDLHDIDSQQNTEITRVTFDSDCSTYIILYKAMVQSIKIIIQSSPKAVDTCWSWTIKSHHVDELTGAFNGIYIYNFSETEEMNRFPSRTLQPRLNQHHFSNHKK
jgi:hypothetical protein